MNSILSKNGTARLLARHDSAEIAERWKNTLSVDVGDDFKRLGCIDYLQCDVTGFRWYEPSQAAGGASIYEQLEAYDWYYMRDKWEFARALTIIEGAKSILEIGVGEGNFLRKARAAGFEARGVELNPKGAKRARALGFQVHEMTLHELCDKTTDRFDVICSFQVLEHVPEPREFLEGMIGMLKPGGRLILSVPNAAVMRQIDPQNRELLNQPPHHMGHWDEGVFRALESLLPLEVVSVHREPLASYHVGWFINAYLRHSLAFLGEGLVRYVVNRYSTLPLQGLMRLGFRKLFPGHTLLVELRHKPF